MGQTTDLILDGVLDYETGEYIGTAVGYPRTVRKFKGKPKTLKMSELNQYGYTLKDWSTMKDCTKEVIIYLYDQGFKSMKSRQKVMDDFMKDSNLLKPGSNNALPKNSRKYSIIYDLFIEFKEYVKSYDYGNIS